MQVELEKPNNYFNDAYSKNYHSISKIYVVMKFWCYCSHAFFSSMLVTNDVSIITLISLLALSISKTAIDPIFPVILLFLAAH